MFAWQVALGVELLVVLVAFFVFLKASNAEAGPRTFVKIVSVFAVVGAVGMAGWTVTNAVLKALDAERAGGTTYFIIFADDDEEKPAPARYVPSAPGSGTKKTSTRTPVPAWKGELQKQKWNERGEAMKRKWAERGA
jgi:hypothetical protein